MSRKLAPVTIFVQVVVIGLFADSVSGIKCYICDSTDNPGCTDLKSTSRIKPEECTVEKMNQLDTWLTELNKISYHGSAAQYHVPMKCQKVIGQKDGGEPVTARHCQFDTKDTDPCSITQERAREKSITIIDCSICDIDKCNGTPARDAVSVLIALLFVSFVHFFF